MEPFRVIVTGVRHFHGFARLGDLLDRSPRNLTGAGGQAGGRPGGRSPTGGRAAARTAGPPATTGVVTRRPMPAEKTASGTERAFPPGRRLAERDQPLPTPPRQDAGRRAAPTPSGTEEKPITTTPPLAAGPAPPPGPAAPDPWERPAAEDPPPGTRAAVLVVDDQSANLLALEAMLADLDLDLVTAGSGFEALRRLLDRDFALILMDVKMPGMDGFETAELIRQRKRSSHTPIIFLTASESAESQVFKGYALGAVDYLVKPIVSKVLRSKVAVFVDIFRKTEQIRRQAEVLRRLEQREHERQLADAKARFEAERLQEELRLAREIQQKLFPAAPLPARGLDIAGGSFPAEATGGDYFDYIPMQDGNLAVVIGDVCGHGFGPALVMAELRAYLRAFLLTRTDVGEIVRLLNRALAGDTDRFVTLFIAKLDPITRSLVYAGAGHLPGYVLGTDGEVKARLESTGIPLGILPDTDYPTESASPLQPGETILLLTDGIVEAHGPDEDLFGIERVLRLVKAHRDRPAREVLNALFGAVRGFCGSAAQPDDMTAIVIKAAAPGAPGGAGPEPAADAVLTRKSGA